MEIKGIDINVDVGEGIDNECLLMPYISSCNIACGGHSGDDVSMRTVIKLAQQFGVKIGAHPSFPDRKNFGRIKMNMGCAELYTSLSKQIRKFRRILNEEHAILHHIKPHGALYNEAASDEKTANVIIELVKGIAHPVTLYVPYNSIIAKLAIAEGIPILYEAFADRNYTADLKLVSRDKEHAVIHDADKVFEHVFRMLDQHQVRTIEGKDIDIQLQTICVHGDNANAHSILQYLKQKLNANNIHIR